MNRRKVFLTLFLATPFLLLGAVLLGIKYSRPAMNAPPIGAGAGSTGGANAIGELIDHGTTTPIKPAPPAPEVVKPKPVSKPIEPSRTVYPRGTLSTLTVKAPPNSPTTTVDVQVFAPPYYDGPKLPGMSYPVLYLIGEKVFDPEGWAADDTASKLMSSGSACPAVIVALPPVRGSEPMVKGTRQEDEKAYDAWLVAEVCPKIGAAYRLKPGPENAGVGGAGEDAWMAGLAVGAHPDMFGLLLRQSPSGRQVARSSTVTPDPNATCPAREFLSLETNSLNDTLGMGDATAAAGRGADRLLVLHDPAGHADMATWRERFPFALAFLYPPPADTTK